MTGSRDVLGVSMYPSVRRACMEVKLLLNVFRLSPFR